MVDIESEIFSLVAVPLRKEFPGIRTYGGSSDIKAEFPAVTIEEKDNYVFARASTTNIENAAGVMYEINAYTNVSGYKKQQAKQIMQFIDNIMSGLKFRRTLCNPVDNLSDATIYRLVARYEATVDTGLMIYQM